MLQVKKEVDELKFFLGEKNRNIGNLQAEIAANKE